MLKVDCNHSYRTRSRTAQLVTPKSSKTKLLTMSLEHRGRVLLNFLLRKKVLTNAEKMTSCKIQNPVNFFQYNLIEQQCNQRNCVQVTCFLFSGRSVRIREHRQTSSPVNLY